MKVGDKFIKFIDGNGLYLLVKLFGFKFWWYKYWIVGKENFFVIGEYLMISF